MVDRRRAGGFQKAFNPVFRWFFRLRKGRMVFKGAPTLILHTIGRRSGQTRATPLLYLDLGDDRRAIVASNGGDDRSPAWFHNLCARPDVEIDLGRGPVPAVASTASDDERAQLWPRLVAMYPSFETYQTKTERPIPVVLLGPRPSAASDGTGSGAPR